jgi:protocatechuate 3,4-dioxygenase beta subunit
MHGKVFDIETKAGIANAVVDIWQASANGKYDFQDPENQPPNNLRGKFRTDAEGNYNYYCLKPTGYSLPQDGKSMTRKMIQANLDRPVVAAFAASGSAFNETRSYSHDGLRRQLQASRHSNLPQG